MNWTILGYVADILGIISFIISLGIFRKVSVKATVQKEIYKNERDELLRNLQALQQNIWDDGLTSEKIQDTLRTNVMEYQVKYFFISSPRCIFHAYRCTKLLKSGITPENKTKIREDICFLIARLSKKE